MSQLKQILRLFLQGYSIKGVARATGISRNTVRGYWREISSREINLQEALNMEDLRLEHLLHAPLKTEKQRHADFLMRLDSWQADLTNPHVTKMLLWEEYKRENPDGYQYSRFCHYLQLHDRSQKAVLVQKHDPGHKLFVDFTGDKLRYVDPGSGEVVTCEVYVATLGYSNYTAVMATHSQKLTDVITATVCALEFIGGVPGAIVPDNLKSVVTQAHPHEPIINDAFLDLANHYGMVVLPTRPAKPRDKAKVERSVNIAYQRIFAPLRKRTFYSLQQINAALQEQATVLNQRLMQQYGCSRLDLLERDERPLLRPLPKESYEMKQQLLLTVQQNCHVYLSKQRKYYSAPYRLIGIKVNVIVTASLIRIYHRGNCLASHPAGGSARYTTVKEHLPSHHQIVLSGMNEQSLRQRARSIGDEVLKVIEKVLQQSLHPEQAYKTCQGILALAKKISREALVESCAIALQYNVCTYRNIQRLAQGRYANRQALAAPPAQLPNHKNLRGPTQYK